MSSEHSYSYFGCRCRHFLAFARSLSFPRHYPFSVTILSPSLSFPRHYSFPSLSFPRHYPFPVTILSRHYPFPSLCFPVTILFPSLSILRLRCAAKPMLLPKSTKIYLKKKTLWCLQISGALLVTSAIYICIAGETESYLSCGAVWLQAFDPSAIC